MRSLEHRRPLPIIRHRELLTERVYHRLRVGFPLPPPAGPPGPPDPPLASASRLAHPSTELAKINMLAGTTLKHGLPSLHAPDILALEAWAPKGSAKVRQLCAVTAHAQKKEPLYTVMSRKAPNM